MAIVIRDGRRIFNRNLAIAITISFLIGRSAVAGVTHSPSLQPGPSRSRAPHSLPSDIVTTDGKVYHAVQLSRVEPDGLLVQYRPAAGGIGMALLKFAKLPESLQKEFGYEPRKASAFEHAQSLATFAMTQKLKQDETLRTAMLNKMSVRPNWGGAVTVNRSAPTVNYTYYAPGHEPVKFGQGYSQCVPHYQCHADFKVHSKPGPAGPPFHFYIDKVNLTLGLSCHITEPKFAFDYIRIEQEGYRKIYEHFYRLGAPVVQYIGESLIGKEFTASGPDIEAAQQAALAHAQAVVQDLYVARVTSVAHRAGAYYTRLIDNGQNSFSRDQAVQEAIAKYAGQINLNFHLVSGPLSGSGNPAVPLPDAQVPVLH